MIRPEIQKKIDTLHAKITKLVEAEKKYHDMIAPNENDLWRHMAHTKIEVAARSPEDRSQMVWATASWPLVG